MENILNQNLSFVSLTGTITQIQEHNFMSINRLEKNIVLLLKKHFVLITEGPIPGYFKAVALTKGFSRLKNRLPKFIGLALKIGCSSVVSR